MRLILTIIFLLNLILHHGIYSQEVKLLPPVTGIYHTAFSTHYSSPNNVSPEEVPYFENLAGKKIVWLNFSNDWFGGIRFPAESVRNIYKFNTIPSIRIMPWSRYDSKDTLYSLMKIVRGDFDKELTQWAKDLNSTGIPVMIDFAAEPNGYWFPWSGIYNGAGKTDAYGDKKIADGPELYKDAYKHIVNLFRENKAEKVTWVFHVNAIGAPEEQWNDINNYYPGDEYVDWIGFSAYGAQLWGESYQRLVDIMSPAYEKLSALNGSKPIAVLEFGVADYLPGVNKALWIQSALYTVQQPEFSRIKAIGWWHSTWWNADGTMSAIQIDSSPESLRFYKEAIAQPVFLGEYRLGEP